MPPPEKIGATMAAVGAHQGELKASGSWVFFVALTQADSATVVQVAGDEVSMTDGPYAEA